MCSQWCENKGIDCPVCSSRVVCLQGMLQSGICLLCYYSEMSVHYTVFKKTIETSVGHNRIQ